MGRVKSFFEIIRQGLAGTGMRPDDEGIFSVKKRRKRRKGEKVSVMLCGIRRNLWNGCPQTGTFEECVLVMKGETACIRRPGRFQAYLYGEEHARTGCFAGLKREAFRKLERKKPAGRCRRTALQSPAGLFRQGRLTGRPADGGRKEGERAPVHERYARPLPERFSAGALMR